MRQINKSGFTLIELLVVVSIIGLLATMSVVSLQQARTKARDARRLADMRQIQTALELYASDKFGFYPSGTDVTLGEENSRCLNKDGWQTRACPAPYMGIVPQDPFQTTYVYNSLNGDASYEMSFTLETDVSPALLAGAHTASPVGIR